MHGNAGCWRDCESILNKLWTYCKWQHMHQQQWDLFSRRIFSKLWRVLSWLSWVVSAISTEFSWNLPWQTDAFSQHRLSRSFQTRLNDLWCATMCHSNLQCIWSNSRLIILSICVFYYISVECCWVLWKQHHGNGVFFDRRRTWMGWGCMLQADA